MNTWSKIKIINLIEWHYLSLLLSLSKLDNQWVKKTSLDPKIRIIFPSFSSSNIKSTQIQSIPYPLPFLCLLNNEHFHFIKNKNYLIEWHYLFLLLSSSKLDNQYVKKYVPWSKNTNNISLLPSFPPSPSNIKSTQIQSIPYPYPFLRLLSNEHLIKNKNYQSHRVALFISALILEQTG